MSRSVLGAESVVWTELAVETELAVGVRPGGWGRLDGCERPGSGDGPGSWEGPSGWATPAARMESGVPQSIFVRPFAAISESIDRMMSVSMIWSGYPAPSTLAQQYVRYFEKSVPGM